MDFNNCILLESLVTAARTERLGHGLILCYQDFNRKQNFEFLTTLVKTLLCLEKSKEPCHRCESCLIFSQFENQGFLNHPDTFWSKPSDRGTYSLEDIKGFLHSFNLRKALSPFRVGILEEAHLLSANSHAPANALLKLLEEPRPDTFIILSSSNPEGILPTLKSRCQSFRIFGGQDSANTCPQGFENIATWFLRGAQSHVPFGTSPASLESYWKDKSMAKTELRELYFYLWQEYRKALLGWDHSSSLRAWDFLNAFEGLLKNLAMNTQGHLQWMQLESSVRVGYYESND